MSGDNPYASPVDCDRGVYDHRLFWRLVKVFWAFALFFVLVDAVILTHGNLTSHGISSWQVLRENLADEWRRLTND